MHNDRIITLGEDLRNHVFNLLDADPEMTGLDAGKVAKATEDAFVQALQAIHGKDPVCSDLERAKAHLDKIRENGWERI